MRWLAVTCLLVTGMLAGATASSAPVHYPASNGWIVFTSDRDINSVAPFRLYRLEPVGGRVEPLGQLRGRQPAWSPDGSLIAFVDAKRRLVVASTDGLRRKTLTSGRYPVQNPSWSPDGSRIVVEQSGRGRARGDLVIVAANGSRLTRITSSRHDDREPSWAPDGSRIAFASNRPMPASTTTRSASYAPMRRASVGSPRTSSRIARRVGLRTEASSPSRAVEI